MQETYTIEQVALMTGLNIRTIRRYQADGLLQGEKVDGAWRFTAEQFGAFLARDAVRASVQTKANAIVCDFMAAGRRKEAAACLILDRPAAGGDEEARLRETMEEAVNRLHLRWAYRWENGMARAILAGAPEALAEMLRIYNSQQNL